MNPKNRIGKYLSVTDDFKEGVDTLYERCVNTPNLPEANEAGERLRNLLNENELYSRELFDKICLERLYKGFDVFASADKSNFAKKASAQEDFSGKEGAAEFGGD